MKSPKFHERAFSGRGARAGNLFQGGDDSWGRRGRKIIEQHNKHPQPTGMLQGLVEGGSVRHK